MIYMELLASNMTGAQCHEAGFSDRFGGQWRPALLGRRHIHLCQGRQASALSRPTCRQTEVAHPPTLPKRRLTPRSLGTAVVVRGC